MCNEHKVLSIGLLTRPGSDRGRSCKWVTMHSDLAIVLTRKGYKEHHWLVVPHQPLQLSLVSPTSLMPSDHHATSSRIIPGSVNQLGIGQAAICVYGQASHCSNQACTITPFMYNKEEYQVSIGSFSSLMF